MDWITEFTQRPGVVFGIILLVHVTIMEWSWLKSVMWLLVYHTIFLLFIAHDPGRAFAPEQVADTRWLLAQTAVLIWLAGLLVWVHFRKVLQSVK